MIPSKSVFLQELERELKAISNKEEVLKECDMHLTEMLLDLQETNPLLTEEDAMKTVFERFGSPESIAACYLKELDVTPKRMKWTFITVNLLLFLGGICLTVSYNLLPAFVSSFWDVLTNLTTLIIFLYMAFWVLLGYEIGKEFGLGGKALLMKTFYFSLLPNLALMTLVLLGIIPFNWFGSLLTPGFITVCIFCTIILFPISYAAYRWGAIRSI